jgi:hypothetical protein
LTVERLASAERLRRGSSAEGFERAAAEAKLEALMSGAPTSELSER